MAARWPFYWRIALASADLAKGAFFAWKLPAPQRPVYADYSVKVPQSQGGMTRQGYDNITLLWDELDGLQLNTLKTIVEAAIVAGALYLTIDRADGSGALNDFVDVHGLPHPLEFTPTASARGTVFSNVQLFVNNLTVDNDPSTVF